MAVQSQLLIQSQLQHHNGIQVVVDVRIKNVGMAADHTALGAAPSHGVMP